MASLSTKVPLHGRSESCLRTSASTCAWLRVELLTEQTSFIQILNNFVGPILMNISQMEKALFLQLTGEVRQAVPLSLRRPPLSAHPWLLASGLILWERPAHHFSFNISTICFTYFFNIYNRYLCWLQARWGGPPLSAHPWLLARWARLYHATASSGEI